MPWNESFVAEINLFPWNRAPRGWALCHGDVLAISQNTALFSLLGTRYGGNGQSTFGLPDLQGCVPLGAGQSTTGSVYDVGQVAGSETITLLQSEIPLHTHTVQASSELGDLQGPAPTRVLARSASATAYQTNNSGNLVMMAPQALSPAGGGLPHNNMMPYLTLSFCIALQGIFPPR